MQLIVFIALVATAAANVQVRRNINIPNTDLSFLEEFIYICNFSAMDQMKLSWNYSKLS